MEKWKRSGVDTDDIYCLYENSETYIWPTNSVNGQASLHNFRYMGEKWSNAYLIKKGCEGYGLLFQQIKEKLI